MNKLPDLPQILPSLRLETSVAKASAYAQLTADFNPIHLDAAFAADTPFGKPIAHGTMSLGLLLLCVEKALGPAWRIEGVEIRFARPVLVGESVIAAGERLAEDGRPVYQVFVETSEGVRAIEGSVRVAPSKTAEG